MNRLGFSIIACFVICMGLRSQQVGSFQLTVKYQNTNGKVSYYVPTDYDKTHAYPLFVAFHGGGGTSYVGAWMRDIFLGFADSVDAILVCPDDLNFTLAILNPAIDTTKELYNVDPNRIFLAGMSLGGRSTMRHGLNNSGKFAGIFSLAPAVQSASEANGSFYNYAGGKDEPVCILIGGIDSYLSNVNLLYNNLVNNGTKAKKIVKPGIGHVDFSYLGSTGFDSDCINCWKHIQNNLNSVIEANRGVISYEIFPNPVSDYLYIKSPAAFSTPYEISLFNMSGSTIKTLPENKGNNIIDVSGLSNGVYMLKIMPSDNFLYDGNGKFTIHKLIVE